MTDIDQIAQDAEDNFINGRLDDAYAHFRQISSYYYSNNEIPTGIYYGYRSILCKSLLKDDLEYSREIMTLGLNLIKFGLNQSQQLLKAERDPSIIIELLQLQYHTIDELNYQGERKEIVNQLIENYEILLDDITLTRDERIAKLEKLIDILKQTTRTIVLKNYKSKLVELLVNCAMDLSFNDIDVYKRHHLLTQAKSYTNDDEILKPIEQELNNTIKYIEENEINKV